MDSLTRETEPAVECGQPFMLLLFNLEDAIQAKGIECRGQTVREHTYRMRTNQHRLIR